MKLFGIVLVLLAFAVDGAQGAGMRTHVEMVDRALQRHLSQAEQMLPGLSQFLAYPGVVRALYSGSTYPDWGYEGINKDEAEASHWWDYQRRYLKRLQAQCAPPWGDATRKRIAFYIGVLCHGVTDIPWHFSTKRHASFLAMTQRKDKAGHGKTEVSVDLFCHGRNRLKSSMRDWWWPYADLLAGFKPGHSASKGQLQRGRNRQIGLWYAAALLGRAPAAALKPDRKSVV